MENLKLIIDTYDKLQTNGLCKDLALIVFDFTGDLTETEDELLKKHMYLKIRINSRRSIRRRKSEYHFCRLCNHDNYSCLHKVTNHGSSAIHQENVKKYHNDEMDLMTNEDVLIKYYTHTYDHGFGDIENLFMAASMGYISMNMIELVR